MSGSDWLTLAGIIAASIVTVGQIINSYFAFRLKAIAMATQITAINTQNIAQKTEINTNSMKDELVKEVRSAALAKGAKDQRDLTANKLRKTKD